MSELAPTPPTTTLDRWVAAIAFIGVVGLFIYYVAWGVHRIHENNLSDFRTFFAAGRAVRDGADPYTSGEGRYVYPPLIAFLCVSFARLTIQHAALVAMGVNVASIAVSLVLVTSAATRRFGTRAIAVWPAVLIAALLSEDQCRAVVQMGETDALMLLCFATAFWALDRLPVLSGAMLGFAINIKYLPLAVLPYLMIRRRWIATMATLGATVLWALLPAAYMGWRENQRCLKVATAGLLPWANVHPSHAQQLNVHALRSLVSISATSSLARAARALHFPGDPGRLALVAAAIIAAAGLALIALLYRHYRQPFLRWPNAAMQIAVPYRALVAIEWALVLSACLAFSPHTNTRHLIITLIINAIAAVLIVDSRAGVSRGLLGAGMAIMLAGYLLPIKGIMPDFSHAWFAAGAAGWSLLIYSVILTIVALRYIQTLPRSAPESASTVP